MRKALVNPVDRIGYAGDFGIDVTLLLANAKLSPARRVAQMDELNRFAAEVQQRTVPACVREALAARELKEKQLALDSDS